jgi:scyllo-inosamine-4-phosphate amidinotransferase 1
MQISNQTTCTTTAPRHFLAVGNTVLETPISLRSRFLETFAYKLIMLDYMGRGPTGFQYPNLHRSTAATA